MTKSRTITKLNSHVCGFIHTGKYKTFKNINEKHISFKYGQLIKTRKPFCFKPKKKKEFVKKPTQLFYICRESFK